MTQTAAFNIADQVRTEGHDVLLIIRDIAVRDGMTYYLVEEAPIGWHRNSGTWWVTHDDLWRAKSSSTT